MAGNMAAVLGTGQTKYVAKRKDVSMNGLVREAIDKALDDSGSTFDDIDAVVVGKAPDFFEGVMMPELFMADAVGATGKPLIRVHTAGSVGGSTAIVAASLVQSGKYKRVLTMAWEKQSESNAMWALSHSGAVHQAGRCGCGWLLRPARAVLHPALGRADAHRRDGRGQGPAQRREEPAGPPAPARHHAGEGDGVPDAVGPDPVRRDLPVLGRRLRAGDRQRGRSPTRAWPTAIRSPGSTPPRCAPNRSPTPGATRSTRRPAATPSAALWRDAGISSPIDEIDVAEVYVPFSWFEPMWLENLGFAPEGEGWKLTEAGETAIGGRIPFNPSGGVLSSNPIGASGMIRFAESAIQVMGKAGDHQVEGARKALGHAYGGGSQYYSMWVVGADKPWTSRRMKYTCSVAMSPLDELVEIAKTAEEVGFDSIALPDSFVLHGAAVGRTIPTPPTVADVERGHPNGRSADRGRRHGCGDHDAAVLHQRDEARLPQPAAACPPGRFGGQPDQQSVRVRRRNRLGT